MSSHNYATGPRCATCGHFVPNHISGAAGICTHRNDVVPYAKIQCCIAYDRAAPEPQLEAISSNPNLAPERVVRVCSMCAYFSDVPPDGFEACGTCTRLGLPVSKTVPVCAAYTPDKDATSVPDRGQSVEPVCEVCHTACTRVGVVVEDIRHELCPKCVAIFKAAYRAIPREDVPYFREYAVERAWQVLVGKTRLASLGVGPNPERNTDELSPVDLERFRLLEKE